VLDPRSRRADSDAVRRILIEIASLYGGLQHGRKCCANAAKSATRMSLLSQVRKHCFNLRGVFR
jgi:hypothetical protein